MLGLYFYEEGHPSFIDLGRDGIKRIHINDIVSIHPSCVYELSRYYVDRKLPEASNKKGNGCLDEQTIGNYVDYILLKHGDYSKLEGELNQSIVEKHLHNCDYCFNLTINVYSLLKEMDLEKRMEGLKTTAEKS